METPLPPPPPPPPSSQEPSAQLKLAFQQAIRDVNILPTSSVSNKKKLILYGLYCYVTKGPLPKATNLDALMHDKVELIKRKSWLTASRLTRVQAMEDYCQIVQELITSHREAKSGFLFREIAPGGIWRKYAVELKDRLLSYAPANSANGTGGGMLFLMQGCVVSLERPETDRTGPPPPYVCFSIAHPKSSKVFTLGAESKEIAQEWIDAIRLEASCSSSSGKGDAGMSSHDLHSLQQLSSSSATTQAFSSNHQAFAKSKLFLPIRPSADFGIPAIYSSKMDQAIAQFFRLTTDASQWNFSGVGEGGVSTFLGVDGKESAQGDAVGVLGHVSVLQAPARCVFDLVWNMDQRIKVDPQMESYSLVEELGKQARVEHLVYSAVWPTSKRDFCRLAHYRVDEQTGSILVMGTAVEHVMCAPNSQVAIRAELLCTGFLIEPLVGGTSCQVKYLILVNPRVASIPKRFIQSFSTSQTQIITRIAKHLRENDFMVQTAMEMGKMCRNPALLANNSGGSMGGATAAETNKRLQFRRRKSSTGGALSGGGGNMAALEYIKTENAGTVTNGRRFVCLDAGGGPAQADKRQSRIWFATCIMLLLVTQQVPFPILVLVCAALAWFTPTAKRRKFLSFTCNNKTGMSETLIALALQRIVTEDCPGLRGRFRSSWWLTNTTTNPSSSPPDHSSHSNFVEEDKCRILQMDLTSMDKGGYVFGSENDFNAVLVCGALVADHDSFTDRALLFCLQGDSITCSVDMRCSKRDFAKLVLRVNILFGEGPAVVTAAAATSPKFRKE